MARTILLADDSKTIRRAVEIVFEKEPYDVVVVGNGDDAITRAKEISPAIIVADHLMPGKSGYEVAAAVSADPSLAGIPVILLTGSASPYDEAKAKASNVSAMLKKPFNCQSLINQVDELLGGRAEGATTSAMPQFSAAGAAPVAAAAPIAPVAPVAPVAPIAPVAPVATTPVAPATPIAPATPVAPIAPITPVTTPVAPVSPTVEPATPSYAAASTLVPQVAAPATPVAAVASQASEVVVERATAAIAKTGETVSAAEVSAVAKDIIERVVWEVVPELAETLIKEEIARLMRDRA